MTIMMNALRERLRRKELYIVVAIGLLILLLFGGGAASITVNGAAVSDFSNMFGVIHVVVNAVGCILAMIISLQTIPNEYERKTSHLIWIRGISQTRYHMELVLANICSVVIATFILYTALAFYVVEKGEFICLPRMIPAFLLVCINIVMISMFTSILSIKLPSFLTGLIVSVSMMGGLLHGILNVYQNMIGGISGKVLKYLLWLVPDLNEIQSQAVDVILGHRAKMHTIFIGVFFVYSISLGLFILKKKEA